MPLLNTNGIIVNYEITGHGPPLLFIHGLGGSLLDWSAQIGEFAQHYQVIVFDLRGHGNSSKPPGPYSIKQFASDVAGLISGLGYESVHVVGHSLGGMIAFQLALDYPQLVKTLTIVNSAPAVIFPDWHHKIQFYWRFASVRLFGMRKLSHSLAEHVFPKPEQSYLRELFIERWEKNDPAAYISSLHAFSGWNVMARLPELRCPVLIITADQDYSPVAFKRGYAQLIANAEVIVIADSHHMTPLDQPQAFNQALQGFLSQH